MLHLPAWFFYTMAGLLGAAVGSFLNVVIWRLPRNQSIVRPRSRCPQCNALIRWYDNIPLISFILLRARCRNCQKPISWRYPLVEGLSAVLALGLMWRFGPSKEFIVHYIFSAALIAVTFIDIDFRIIPNEITLGGAPLAFGCSFLWPGFWKHSLIGFLIGGVSLFVIGEIYTRLRHREGMGMGDVKLLGLLGAWLGWQCLPFVLLFASLQGVAGAIVLWLSGVKLAPPLPEEDEEETEPATPAEEEEPRFLLSAIPFGPFLSLAAVEYLFLGPWFYSWLRGGL